MHMHALNTRFQQVHYVHYIYRYLHHAHPSDIVCQSTTMITFVETRIIYGVTVKGHPLPNFHLMPRDNQHVEGTMIVWIFTAIS